MTNRSNRQIQARMAGEVVGVVVDGVSESIFRLGGGAVVVDSSRASRRLAMQGGSIRLEQVGVDVVGEFPPV